MIEVRVALCCCEMAPGSPVEGTSVVAKVNVSREQTRSRTAWRHHSSTLLKLRFASGTLGGHLILQSTLVSEASIRVSSASHGENSARRRTDRGQEQCAKHREGTQRVVAVATPPPVPLNFFLARRHFDLPGLHSLFTEAFKRSSHVSTTRHSPHPKSFLPPHEHLTTPFLHTRDAVHHRRCRRCYARTLCACSALQPDEAHCSSARSHHRHGDQPRLSYPRE